MTIAEIISQFRLDNYIDTSQLTDAQALVFVNRTYRDVINEIRVKVNEDYFYNEWKTDTVVWQREYTLLKRTSSVIWMTKIKWISIKYQTTDTEYTKAKLETIWNLDKDLQRYIVNQPKTNPFYIISDESIFLYPAPTEGIVDWIIFYWIWDPVDLLTTSVSTDIKIPVEYQEILPLWMLYHSFRARWMISEKNDAKNEYELEKIKMISELSDRVSIPEESEMLNLTYFW